MALSRRDLLIGAAAALLGPRRALAQSAPDRDHQIRFELPILSEDATAVPMQVGVEHPMEPDHFIRSVEIRLDQDPVPYKGTFLFTPANGRAWVAFPMRSGVGGMVRAVAECSRHGRFVGTRELRVADGGCTTGPDPATRERQGSPQIALPRSLRPGEIIEVKTRIYHASETGLALTGGKFVRERPEFYLKQMLVFLDGEKVSEFRMTSAVSSNPIIRFPFKVSRSGTLRVVFVNSEGKRWEASQPVRV